MALTLYDCATAPSPRRARILLAEKAATWQTVEINLREGQQFTPAFRAVNPHCTVPALVTDEGPVLTDNAAIAAYLEARFPEPPLLGRTPLEKAEIASWHWRGEFDGLMAVAEALRNSTPAMAGRALPGPVGYEQIPALAERGLARLRQFLDTLEERLTVREFVAADAFSIADVIAVVALDFARIVKVKPGDGHVHLKAWRERLAARPSVGPAPGR